MTSVPKVASEVLVPGRCVARTSSGWIAWFIASRLLFNGMLLVGSTYLVFATFTASYFGIGPADLTDWVRVSIRFFPLVYWIASLAVSSTLLESLRRPETRRLAIGFIACLVIGGIALQRFGLLAAPQDYRGIIWSVLVWFPAAWLAVLDAVTLSDERGTQVTEPNVSLPGVAICTAIVAATFAITAVARTAHALDQSLLSLSVLALLAIAYIVVLVTGVISTATVLLRVAWQWKANRALLFVLTGLFWWVVAFSVLRRIVAPAISFNSSWADLWAALLPVGAVVSLVTTTVCARSRKQTPLAVGPLELFRCVSPRAGLVLGAGGLILSALFVPAIAPLDWQSLFQHGVALSVLVACLVLTPVSRPALRPISTKSLAIAAAVSVTATLLLFDLSSAAATLGGRRAAEAAPLFLSFDPLSRAGRKLLQTPFRDSTAGEFYRFLASNSMITAEISAPALQVAPLDRRPAQRPDIYIIVVDSLRPDFLQPYAPSERTPHVAAFANEGFVFRNAFTNFAGTMLAEPSIWTGAQLIQHQYPRPFSNLNGLEKLTSADGYVRVLARDAVLDPLLERRPTDRLVGHNLKYWTELTADLALNETVEHLDRIPSGQPVFTFVQPQDTHGVAMSIRRTRDPQFQALSSFEQYRRAVSEFDGAFGKFVDELKRRGRYDNSIIVLTADHGDGIGDYGRWGHSESVLPGVTRVPLIVHLPPKMAASVTVDLNSPAMLTDIAPSLYYLLGHRPIARNPIVGRPLFTETEAEQKRYAAEYRVIGNCYGPRFAVVDRSAERYFVVDAVAGTEAAFDLKSDPHALRNLITAEDQKRAHRQISETLEQVNAFYSYTAQSR